MKKMNVRNVLKRAMLLVGLIAIMVFMVPNTKTYAANKKINGADTQEMSTKFSYNMDYTVSFTFKGDSDWYVFTPIKGNYFYDLVIKNYTLDTGGNSYYGFITDIYSENGELVVSCDTPRQSENHIRFKITDQTVKYYIHFYMAEGTYSGWYSDDFSNVGNYYFNVKATKDAVGDTESTATSLKNRTTINGKIEGYTNYNSSRNDESLLWAQETQADVDMYKFKAPASGKYVFKLTNRDIESGYNPYLQLQMCLTNSNGAIMKTADTGEEAFWTANKGCTEQMVVFLVKNKTYYLQINNGKYSAGNLGNYKIGVYDQKYLTAITTKPAITAKVSKNKVSLSWKKVSNVAKYEVYRSTSKNGKYTKVATVKSNKYTDKKVKKGKTYYYKVRAVLMTDKTNIKKVAKLSSAKKVKVPKK